MEPFNFNTASGTALPDLPRAGSMSHKLGPYLPIVLGALAAWSRFSDLLARAVDELKERRVAVAAGVPEQPFKVDRFIVRFGSIRTKCHCLAERINSPLGSEVPNAIPLAISPVSLKELFRSRLQLWQLQA